MNTASRKLAICIAAAGLMFSADSLAQTFPPKVSFGNNIQLVRPSKDWDDSVLLSKGSHDIKTLIITVEFADQLATIPNPEWATRLIGDSGEKSLFDYFANASYGQVHMTPADETYGKNNGVIGPFMMQEPELDEDGNFVTDDQDNVQYVGDLNHPNTGSLRFDEVDGITRNIFSDIFRQAIRGADPYVDFSSFNKNGDQFIDSSELAIFIVAAGFNAGGSSSDLYPMLRGHAPDLAITTTDEIFPVTARKAGFSVVLPGEHAIIGELAQLGDEDLHATTLGTFAHEAGHFVFGLPDLYDVDGKENGDSKGIYMYGLMGSGSQGMDPTVDRFQGETPVLPSAWSLYKLGWGLTTTHFAFESLVATGSPLLVSQLHNRTARIGKVIPGVVDPYTGEPDCDSQEYFLVHYRTAEGYDRGLPVVLDSDTFEEYSGVVIYHINEDQNDNNTADRKLVAVETAFGLLDYSSLDPLQLWVNNGINEYQFDAYSEYGNSNVGQPAEDDSGVSITVGPPTVGSDGASAINLTVESNCQDTGTTVLIP